MLNVHHEERMKRKPFDHQPALIELHLPSAAPRLPSHSARIKTDIKNFSKNLADHCW